MRIGLVSDLHLEWADLILPGGDNLIIAGDAMEAKSYQKKLYNPNWTPRPFEDPLLRKDRCARFFEEEMRKYQNVFYVLGNHEHYRYQLHKTAEYLKKQMPDNVHLLDNESFDLEDVTFVGSTMWTDMNKKDWHTMYQCKRSMADYSQVIMLNEAKNVYHRLIPEHTVDIHDKSKAYVRATVEARPDRKFVVITHHAPSKLSIKPRFEKDVLMNGAYSSDLSEIMLDNPQIKVWVHGHTHDNFDYMIGETRIICNPRGYYGHESTAHVYNPAFSFDV